MSNAWTSCLNPGFSFDCRHDVLAMQNTVIFVRFSHCLLLQVYFLWSCHLVFCCSFLLVSNSPHRPSFFCRSRGVCFKGARRDWMYFHSFSHCLWAFFTASIIFIHRFSLFITFKSKMLSHGQFLSPDLETSSILCHLYMYMWSMYYTCS